VKWEEDRTEVTEVTEGDRDWWGKRCGERLGFRCESQATGESIAQRSRRSQRGIGIGGENAAVTSGLPVREPGKRGKHRTEVTEGDGG
jgi:hypothetical protein